MLFKLLPGKAEIEGRRGSEICRDVYFTETSVTLLLRIVNIC